MVSVLDIIALVSLLAAFILGYICGKYYGKIRGYAEGKSVAPLLLRQISLEKGYCALCTQSTLLDENPAAIRRCPENNQYKNNQYK